MTFGGPLDSFRIGAGGQKNHVFTVLGFSVPPGPPGRQHGKQSVKILWERRLQNFKEVWTVSMVQKRERKRDVKGQLTW